MPPRSTSARGPLLSGVLLAAFAVITLSSEPAVAQVAGKIAVYPQTSSVEFTSTKQFSAYVPISPNAIAWFVNDVRGGNAALGTISSTGLYQPPPIIPPQHLATTNPQTIAFPSSF